MDAIITMLICLITLFGVMILGMLVYVFKEHNIQKLKLEIARIQFVIDMKKRGLKPKEIINYYEKTVEKLRD